MSYLLDKKVKRKKILKIALGLAILIVLFYLRLNIWHGLVYLTQTIFRPVLVLGNTVREKSKNLNAYFLSKNSLYQENKELRLKLAQEEIRMANYVSLLGENEQLKEILGRKKEKLPLILAFVLANSNQGIYDTLLIDAGANQGITVGQIVLAFGDVPIGRIAEVFSNSAKVILFSSAGEKTQVLIPAKFTEGGEKESTSTKDILMELIGRGGGNFEIILPSNLVIEKGSQATMPGINPYLIATVEDTISDPNNLFSKVLLRSPINVRELKFVEVEKQNEI